MSICQQNTSKTVDFEDFYKDQHGKFEKLYSNKKLLNKLEEELINSYYIFTKSWKGKSYDINELRKKNFINGLSRLGMGKVYVIYIYRKMVIDGKLPEDNEFLALIQKKPVRNASGVNAFAILLPPFPDGQPFSCKHNCYYCPNETVENGAKADMPRSYISEEPAVARGLRNDWDAIKQLKNRFDALLIQGHTLGKLDLILEGGTYTEYPMDFLERFHRDLFYCANTYYESEHDKRKPLTLEEEIKINITSSIQIIGICIETRPDAITDDWIKFFRRAGVTRIQLGVQHTNDSILKKVNRGHTFEDSCRAVDMLKNNCFKIDIHLMPDLPFTTPEDDIEMFNIVFGSDRIQPDQVKVYPCQVTPYTEIKKWYDNGKYVPYFESDMDMFLDVIQHAMTIVPPWVRLPRVVRDIPANFIEGGNTKTNLRQIIENRMKTDGDYSMDIRNREIGRHSAYNNCEPYLKIRNYRSGSGLEYFISYESEDEKVIYGFTRLRIPDSSTHNPVFPTLKNRGLIRELHVYNNIVATGKKGNSNSSSQHKGLGKSLIKYAEWISWNHGMRGTAVITGEGVRSYYHKKLGYCDEDTFVVKDFMFHIDYLKYFNVIVLIGCLVYLYIKFMM